MKVILYCLLIVGVAASIISMATEQKPWVAIISGFVCAAAFGYQLGRDT